MPSPDPYADPTAPPQPTGRRKPPGMPIWSSPSATVTATPATTPSPTVRPGSPLVAAPPAEPRSYLEALGGMPSRRREERPADRWFAPDPGMTDRLDAVADVRRAEQRQAAAEADRAAALSEREQRAAAEMAQKQRNFAVDQEAKRLGRDTITNPEGDRVYTDTMTDWAVRKQAEQEDALKEAEYRRDGRSFYTDPRTKRIAPEIPDAEWQARQQERAAIDRTKAIESARKDLETAEAATRDTLTTEERRRLEARQAERQTQIRAALAERLASDPAATETTGGFLGFGARPTERAASLAARRNELETGGADPTPEEWAALEQDEAWRPAVQEYRQAQAQLAADDENRAWHDDRERRRLDQASAAMEALTGAPGQPANRAEGELPTQPTRRGAVHGTREPAGAPVSDPNQAPSTKNQAPGTQNQEPLSPSAYNAAAEDYQYAAEELAQRDALLQDEFSMLDQQAFDLVTRGLSENERVELADGQVYPRSLIAARQALEEKRFQHEQDTAPERARLQAAAEPLRLAGEQLRQQVETARVEQRAQRAQWTADLRKREPALAPVADEIEALERETRSRIDRAREQFEPGPELDAALDTITRDTEARSGELIQRVQGFEGVRDQIGQLAVSTATEMARLDAFHAQDPASRKTAADEKQQAFSDAWDAARELAKQAGLPESVVRPVWYDAHRSSQAWLKDEQARVLPGTGRVIINPAIAFDDKAVAAALEKVEASASAKQQARENLPAMRRRLAVQLLPTLRESGDFRRWEAKNASRFRGADDDPEAGMGVQAESEMATAYFSEMTPGRKVLNQVAEGLEAGAHDIRTQFHALPAAVSTLLADHWAPGLQEYAATARSLAEESAARAEQSGRAAATTPAQILPFVSVADLSRGATSLAPVVATGGLTGGLVRAGAAGSLGRIGQAALRLSGGGAALSGGMSTTQATNLASQIGLRGASGMAFVQSFGGTYVDARKNYLDQGYSDTEAGDAALRNATLAGLTTFALTRLGGRFGPEALLAGDITSSRTAMGAAELVKQLAAGTASRQMFKRELTNLGKQLFLNASGEGIEEWADETIQGLITYGTNAQPGMTLHDVINQGMTAGWIGAGLGGGTVAIQESAGGMAGALDVMRNRGTARAAQKRAEDVAATLAGIDAWTGPDRVPEGEQWTEQDTAAAKARAKALTRIAAGVDSATLAPEELAAVGLQKKGGKVEAAKAGLQMADYELEPMSQVEIGQEGQATLTPASRKWLETYFPKVSRLTGDLEKQSSNLSPLSGNLSPDEPTNNDRIPNNSPMSRGNIDQTAGSNGFSGGTESGSGNGRADSQDPEITGSASKTATGSNDNPTGSSSGAETAVQAGELQPNPVASPTEPSLIDSPSILDPESSPQSAERTRILANLLVDSRQWYPAYALAVAAEHVARVGIVEAEPRVQMLKHLLPEIEQTLGAKGKAATSGAEMGRVAAAKAWSRGVREAWSRGVVEKAATAAAELKQARKDVERNPTEAQIEAGNYAKGHVKILGLDITIENPKGSTRSGTDKGGKAWSIKMANDYGYFKRTEGKDGDQVDTFIGPDLASEQVFVVNQIKQDSGQFDEHKVMLGFQTAAEARAAYLANYSPGWKAGPIAATTLTEFKTWLKEGDTSKPFKAETPPTKNPAPRTRNQEQTPRNQEQRSPREKISTATRRALADRAPDLEALGITIRERDENEDGPQAIWADPELGEIAIRPAVMEQWYGPLAGNEDALALQIAATIDEELEHFATFEAGLAMIQDARAAQGKDPLPRRAAIAAFKAKMTEAWKDFEQRHARTAELFGKLYNPEMWAQMPAYSRGMEVTRMLRQRATGRFGGMTTEQVYSAIFGNRSQITEQSARALEHVLGLKNQPGLPLTDKFRDILRAVADFLRGIVGQPKQGTRPQKGTDYLLELLEATEAVLRIEDQGSRIEGAAANPSPSTGDFVERRAKPGEIWEITTIVRAGDLGGTVYGRPRGTKSGGRPIGTLDTFADNWQPAPKESAKAKMRREMAEASGTPQQEPSTKNEEPRTKAPGTRRATVTRRTRAPRDRDDTPVLNYIRESKILAKNHPGAMKRMAAMGRARKKGLPPDPGDRDYFAAWDGAPKLADQPAHVRPYLEGIFSRTQGLPPDEMADELATRGLIPPDGRFGDMYEAIDRELRTIDRDLAPRGTDEQGNPIADPEQQAENFARDVLSPTTAKEERLATELQPGDKLTVEGGEVLRVDRVLQDGRVVLSDGQTYGTQIIQEEDRIYVDLHQRENGEVVEVDPSLQGFGAGRPADGNEQMTPKEWARQFPDSDAQSRFPNDISSPNQTPFQPGTITAERYGDNPYVYQDRWISVKDFDPRVSENFVGLEGLPYDAVASMETTRQYADWYRQGFFGEPVTVVFNVVTNNYKSTNRRRIVAALEAGVEKIPARVEIGRAADLMNREGSRLNAARPTRNQEPGTKNAPFDATLAALERRVARGEILTPAERADLERRRDAAGMLAFGLDDATVSPETLQQRRQREELEQRRNQRLIGSDAGEATDLFTGGTADGQGLLFAARPGSRRNGQGFFDFGLSGELTNDPNQIAFDFGTNSLNNPSSNDPTERRNLERDLPAGAGDASRQDRLSPERRPDRGNGESLVPGGTESGTAAPDRVPAGDLLAALGGTLGDSGLSGTPSGEPAIAAGDPEPAGSREPDGAGVAPEQPGKEDAAVSLGITGPPSATLGTGGETSGLIADILRTAPALKAEQAADVAFLEKRFSTESGALLTNGTGTGKTFSGLGLVARLLEQGKRHVLVVAPSDKVGSDWVNTARDFFGIADAAQLRDTRDNGTGNRVVVTTYANLGQNDSLAARPWDAIVADEAHYLSQNQAGEETLPLKAIRALTAHPGGVYRYAEMQRPDLVKRIADIQQIDYRFRTDLNIARLDEARRILSEISDAQRARIAAMPKASRPKVLMLSATPFAYHFSLDYAEGYLYDLPPDTGGRGYNQPSPRSAFYINHLGYRMRTGKLTQPENATAIGILERRLAEHLMKSGAMAGRSLDVDQDYGREFVLTESRLGSRIDEIFKVINDPANGLGALRDKVGLGNYLERRYLFEALKARESIGRIRQHLALGRKVVVFHDYKKGGAANPLPDSLNGEVTTYANGRFETVQINDLLNQLKALVPAYDEIRRELGGLRAPLDLFADEFGDTVGIFNGSVPKERRRALVDRFNRADSGMDILLVQRASGKEGISLHDRAAERQRVLVDLGFPARPTDAIQGEGRIYRLGVQSPAIFEYLTTGTDTERHTFAQTIAKRSSTAENLAMGSRARALLQAFADGYNGATDSAPSLAQGSGGKAADASRNNPNPFQDAVGLYFTNQKKTSRNKSAEGVDYFATLEPLGYKMVEWAGIREGEKVLEPSAGHGAIARFFPDATNRHAVEPSFELVSRLMLNATDTQVHQQRFEDYATINKFDAVVMNPPFGTAGKTAMDHVAKATKHLRNGGRVVALVPDSPSMEKRLDQFLESDEAASIYLTAQYRIPGVAFSRTGTTVNTRVIILDKTDDPNGLATSGRGRDFSANTIESFFKEIENANGPARATVIREEPAGDFTETAVAEPVSASPAASAPATTYPTPSDPSSPARFSGAEGWHAKKQAPTYVAKIDVRLERPEYEAALALAKQHGGYYSNFKGAGAVPGFQFPSAESRDAFLHAAAGSSQPLYAARPVQSLIDTLPAKPGALVNGLLQGRTLAESATAAGYPEPVIADPDRLQRIARQTGLVLTQRAQTAGLTPEQVREGFEAISGALYAANPTQNQAQSTKNKRPPGQSLLDSAAIRLTTAVGRASGFTGLADSLARWYESDPLARPLRKIIDIARREAVPLHLLDREVTSHMAEMRVAQAFGQEQAMDVLRAVSGRAKFSDLAWPKQYANDAGMRKRLWMAMTGNGPGLDTLPPEVATIGRRMRALLEEAGMKAVREGRMHPDTFEDLRGTYLPEYYLEHELAQTNTPVGIFRKLKLGMNEILAQRMTGFRIEDTEEKDETGQDKLVTYTEPGSSRQRWRFRDKDHRDAYWETYTRRRAVEAMQHWAQTAKSGLPRAEQDAIRALPPDALDRMEELPDVIRGYAAGHLATMRRRYRREKPLTLVEREKAGLIMDPVYSVAKYLAHMEHDNATASFFNTLSADASGRKWIGPANTDGYTQIPDHAKFGSLRGKWVKNEIASQVMELVGAANDVARFYDAALTLFKTGKTVWNPGTHIRNVLGNVMFAHLAGVNPLNPLNAPHYRNALQTIWKGGDTLEEMYREGVLGGDFLTAELRGQLQSLLPLDTVETAGDPWLKLTVLLQKAVRKSGASHLKNWVENAYQLEDEVYKAAAYLKAKQSGLDPKAAAAHVRKWFAYYDQIGSSKSIKVLRRTAMPFFSFQREAIRILGNAARERPVALAYTLALPVLITQMSFALLGIGEKDKEEVRKTLNGKGRFFGRHTPLFSMLLPKRDGEGRLAQFDMTNVMPFASLLGRRREFDDEETLLQSLAKDFIAGSPIVGLPLEVATNQDFFTGNRLWEDNMTGTEKARQIAAQTWSTLMPPLMPPIPRVTNNDGGMDTGGGSGWNMLAQAGERRTNRSLERRNEAQSLARGLVGIDIKSAAPSIYDLVDAYMEARGIPRTESDPPGTTPESRARRRIWDALVKGTDREATAGDEAEALRRAAEAESAIAQEMAYLRSRGRPIETESDVRRLVSLRNPAMVFSRVEDRQDFERNYLRDRPETAQAWREAIRAYESTLARGKGILARAIGKSRTVAAAAP